MATGELPGEPDVVGTIIYVRRRRGGGELACGKAFQSGEQIYHDGIASYMT